MLKFKGFMVERQIPQKEVADLLGISLPTANKKINGKADFTLPEIKALCKNYDISADEYFI